VAPQCGALAPPVDITDDFKWCKQGVFYYISLSKFYISFDKNLVHIIPNYLTLEDVPPASLGGRAIVLTCNSKTGHNLA